MRTVVWIVAGVLALDVLLVAWLSLVDGIRRRRAQRAGAGAGVGTVAEPAVGVVTAVDVVALPSAAAARRPSERHGLRRASFVAGAVALSLLAAAQLRGDLRPTVAAWTERLGGTALAPRVAEHRTREATSRVEAERDATPGSGGIAGQVTPPAGGVRVGLTIPASVAARPRSPARIVIVWTPVPGAVEYHVQRSDETDWSTIATKGSDVTTFTDTGLEPETTYAYRVVTVTEDGTIPPSDVVMATTPAAPPAATTLSGSTSDTGASLSWTAVDGATGYRVERSSGGGEWIQVATTAADVLAFEDTGLTPGATYDYRVTATGESGEGPASNVVSLTVPDGGTTPEAGDGGTGTVVPSGDGADAVSPSPDAGANAVSPPPEATSIED